MMDEDEEEEIPFINYPATSSSRRVVRSTAARSSADARLATMARNQATAASRSSSAAAEGSQRRGASQSGRRSTPRTGSPSVAASTTGSPFNTSSTFLIDFALTLQVDPRRLCFEIFNSLALWQVCAFVIATDYSGFPGRVPGGPDGAGTLWLKNEALGTIQAMVSAPATADDAGPLAASVAVLAAWEIRYGDTQVSELHIGAWRRILSTQLPTQLAMIDRLDARSHVCTMLDRLVESMYHTCRDMTSTGRQPVYIPVVADFPSGFDVFSPWTPTMHDVFNAVGQIANFNPLSTDATPRAREIILQLLLVKPSDEAATPRSYAFHHVQNAALALVSHLYRGPQVANRVDSTYEMQMLRAATEALGLRDFEASLGTPFQEVTFWSLWILCVVAGSWDQRSVRILSRLQHGLRLSTVEQVKTILMQYAYEEERLYQVSRALFDEAASINQ